MRNCNCPGKYRGKNLPLKSSANTAENNSDSVAEVEEELTSPLVDIIENDNEFVILADMPGADAETLEVKYSDGELTIAADAVEMFSGEDEVEYTCCQFDPGSYFRNFRIGESINSDAITADYADGVLTVVLPKREEIQPRKIDVKKK